MLTTRQFLEDILPPLTEGGTYVYCTRSIFGERKWFTNYNYDNIETLVNLIDKEPTSILKENNSQTRVEFYHALAEYKNNEEDITIESKGKSVKRRKIKRTQECASSYACLAFDIDVGTNKPYKQQTEAIPKLHETMGTIGVLHYGVISSGNGVHVYILLDDPVSRGDWVSFSRKLAFALRANELEVDMSKVFEPAMILRPVGSMNKKEQTNYKKVEALQWTDYRYTFTHIEHILSSYEELSSSASPGQWKPSNKAVDFSLQAINDYEEIERGCPQLAALAINAEVPEPHWYTAIGIAAYCKEAEKAAIRWSENYSKFNANETIRKMHHWRRVGAGPSTCARFQSHNPTGCRDCKYKGIIKTPLMAKEFKKEYKMEGLSAGKFPYGYFMKEDFGTTTIYKAVPDEDPAIVLQGYLLYVEGLATLYHERNPQTFVKLRYLCPFMNQPALLEVPLNSIAGASKVDGFINKLADAGVIVESNRIKLVQDYIYASIKEKQREEAPSQIADQFGWTSIDSFIWGIYNISKDSIVKVTPKNTTFTDMTKHYAAKGSLEEWKKMTRIFSKENTHFAAFTFFLGFGAPLMKFTGLGGCLVNLYSPESGSGKSSSGNFALSIYGDHMKTSISPQSTETYLFTKLGVLNNLPVFIDEVSDWSPSRVSDMIYYASQGIEKGRATKDIELRKSSEWNTIIITSSNQSLRDKLDEHTHSNEGQKQRLLEIPLDRNELFVKYGKAINAVALANNYGVAGEVYLKHLVAMNKSGELADQALNARERYESEMGFEFLGEERFIAATIAAAYMGAKIAQQIELISSKILIKEVFREINAVVKRQRVMNIESKETSFDAVNEFVNSNQHKMVKVKTVDIGYELSNVGSCPDGEIMGRLELWYKHAKDTSPRAGIITLAVSAFKSYCIETNRPYNRYLSDLRDSGVNFKMHKVPLASGLTQTVNGTMAPKTSVQCFSITIPPEILASYNFKNGD